MKLNYPASLIQLFLNELKVPVSASTIKKEVYKHPNNNSVLGLSELMNNWNVPNGAFSITFDELLANDVSYPFITRLADNQFIVVKGIHNGNFIVGDAAKKKYLISSDKFKSKFNEWIFIAEKHEGSGEINYKKNRMEEMLSSSRLPLVVCGALLSILFLLINQRINIAAVSWRVSLVIALKSIGVFMTLLLLSQSAGNENMLLKRVCKIGKGDCNSILASDAAKITSWLSWSEVGFFYFMGTWLIAIFNINRLPEFELLAVVNLLSLPYTFFSIYYQWRVAKRWCILCCTVQAVLWLEFLVLFPTLKNAGNMLYINYALVFVQGMFPILLWIFIKPYLSGSSRSLSFESALAEFKYNTDSFKHILERTSKTNMLTEDRCVTLGNPESKNIVTIVTDPFCKPCAKAHLFIDHLLARKEDLKVQIIYRIAEDDDSLKMKLAGDFIDLYLMDDEGLLKKAFHAWYSDKTKSYIKWSLRFPVVRSVRANEFLDSHKNWCRVNKISETPTIFFNGNKLPAAYELEDINYLF